jgi:predicted transcriptional regulator
MKGEFITHDEIMYIIVRQYIKTENHSCALKT